MDRDARVVQLYALFNFLVKVGEMKADGCDSNVLETLEKDYTAGFADSTVQTMRRLAGDEVAHRRGAGTDESLRPRTDFGDSLFSALNDERED